LAPKTKTAKTNSEDDVRRLIFHTLDSIPNLFLAAFLAQFIYHPGFFYFKSSK